MARITEQDYDLLSAYLDGELSEADRSALETRLQADIDLRAEVETLRATVELIRALPPLRAPRDYTLDAHTIRPARLWLFPATATFSALSAAAATLLLVLGLITLFSASPPKSTPANMPQIAAQLTVGLTLSPTEADLSAADAASKASPTEEAEVFGFDAQEEAATPMQREVAPDALLVPGGLPAPQESPLPPMMMESAAPTGTADRYAGAAVEAPSPLNDTALAQAVPPTETATPTSPPPTFTPTLTPTPTPDLTAAPTSTTLATALLIAGAALLTLAVITTLIRWRSR